MNRAYSSPLVMMRVLQGRELRKTTQQATGRWSVCDQAVSRLILDGGELIIPCVALAGRATAPKLCWRDVLKAGPLKSFVSSLVIGDISVERMRMLTWSARKASSFRQCHTVHDPVLLTLLAVRTKSLRSISGEMSRPCGAKARVKQRDTCIAKKVSFCDKVSRYMNTHRSTRRSQVLPRVEPL